MHSELAILVLEHNLERAQKSELRRRKIVHECIMPSLDGPTIPGNQIIKHEPTPYRKPRLWLLISPLNKADKAPTPSRLDQLLTPVRPAFDKTAHSPTGLAFKVHKFGAALRASLAPSIGFLKRAGSHRRQAALSDNNHAALPMRTEEATITTLSRI